MHNLSEKERLRLEGLRLHQNKWVAVVEYSDGEVIVGSGNDAVEAKADAKTNGFDEVVLFWVRPTNMGFVGRALAA